MEKLIYVLGRPPATTVEAFSETLRGPVADELLRLGARGLSLNIADAAVAPAATLRQTHVDPPLLAFLNLWVDSSIRDLRRPFEEVIAECSPGFASYLVTESRPLLNQRHVAVHGERTEGFAQVALFRRLPTLDHEGFLDIWLNSHTQIAIETQSTFEYVQNLVVRRLTPMAPGYDAIVEECFPAAAMTDPTEFFGTPGKQEEFRRNLQRMMGSVARFIDLRSIEVVPTSQYVVA